MKEMYQRDSDKAFENAKSKGLNADIRGSPLKLGEEIKKFLWSRPLGQTWS